MSKDHNINIVGKVLHQFDSLPSTNTFAIDLLASGKPLEGTVVSADHQTAGRGQLGTEWQSPPGLNLTLSVILRPVFLEVLDQFYLNKAISLAMFQLVDQFFPGRARIKWPNDIYIGECKVCGILIQNAIQGQRIHWSVVGIGLNVNQFDFSNGLPYATSFAREANQLFELVEVRNLLFGKVDHFYQKLRESKTIMDLSYAEALYRRHKATTFTLATGELLEGSIQNVDAMGRLIIKDLKQDEIRHFNFKEIIYR